MSEPLDIRLSFRFGETDKRQLDEICEATAMDASSVLRYLIRERRRELTKSLFLKKSELKALNKKRGL